MYRFSRPIRLRAGDGKLKSIAACTILTYGFTGPNRLSVVHRQTIPCDGWTRGVQTAGIRVGRRDLGYLRKGEDTCQDDRPEQDPSEMGNRCPSILLQDIGNTMI